MEPSYVSCEGLINGRLSFQGMNPGIEKLMEARMKNVKDQVEVKEADVSDEQMVQWQKMQAKFNVMNRKRHRKTNIEVEVATKKQKFLKPVD